MKFAKTAALLLSLSIAGVSLAACSNEPEPVSSDVNIIATQDQNTGNTVSGASDADAAVDRYVFTYAGVDYIVNTDVDESKLPDDYELEEVASCAGQGMTKMYTLKNGTIGIETMVGTDTIARIAIFNDTVATPEGISTGMTADQVKAVYGEPAEAIDTLYIYEKGGTQLRFTLVDGKVDEINYMAPGLI